MRGCNFLYKTAAAVQSSTWPAVQSARCSTCTLSRETLFNVAIVSNEIWKSCQHLKIWGIVGAGVDITFTLIPRKNFPSCFDNCFQNLKRIVL